tara:strand:- start:453 stop:581 length:129 start_codon:yes stop_codon:yes gene_type:complete
MDFNFSSATIASEDRDEGSAKEDSELPLEELPCAASSEVEGA